MIEFVGEVFAGEGGIGVFGNEIDFVSSKKGIVTVKIYFEGFFRVCAGCVATKPDSGIVPGNSIVFKSTVYVDVFVRVRDDVLKGIRVAGHVVGT